MQVVGLQVIEIQVKPLDLFCNSDIVCLELLKVLAQLKVQLHNRKLFNCAN